MQERAHDIKDGVIEALTHPAIMPVTAAMASVALVLMGSFMTIIPILIRDAHHGSSAQFTFVNIAFWTGTIVSNATLMRMPSIHYPGRAMAIALIGGMGVLFLLSFETPFWVLCLLTFVWGMGAGVTMTMGRTVVQKTRPTAIGRAFFRLSACVRGRRTVRRARVRFRDRGRRRSRRGADRACRHRGDPHGSRDADALVLDPQPRGAGASQLSMTENMLWNAKDTLNAIRILHADLDVRLGSER